MKKAENSPSLLATLSQASESAFADSHSACHSQSCQIYQTNQSPVQLPTCKQAKEGELWAKLACTQKPILLYGMGNGADKVLAVCHRKGIPVKGIFAGDEFVRGQLFHGMPVLTFAQAKEQYGANGFIALLCFGTCLPDVTAYIARIASECTLYAPDVPVFGDTLFDAAFYATHYNALAAAQALLADDASRALFADIIQYKLTGELQYLTVTNETRAPIYTELLHAEAFRSYLDLGAYNGDTVRELIPFSPHLETVYAWEPDRRSFAKLSAYADSEKQCQVFPIPCAAWSEPCTLSFDDSGNRNASLLDNASADVRDRIRRITEVNADTPDRFLKRQSLQVDFIKYDVEGAEHHALLGTRETIAETAPALLVSAYHRSEDLFDLPLLLHDLQPAYRLYLRRTPYIPAWDLHLLAVAK